MRFVNQSGGWFVAVALGMVLGLQASNAAQWRSAAPNQDDGNTSKQPVLELYQQIQSLQEEVANLRNKVELQENEMLRLKNRLRSVTEDLDRRLQQLERGGVAAPRSRSSAPAVPAVSNDGGDQKAYDAAFRLMKQGDYTRAAHAFRKFLTTYSTSPLAGNAQYWIAESNYLVRNYKLALEEFEKVRTAHPNSRKVPDAMLKIGYCQYELRNYSKARDILTEVTHRYPNTLVARSAKARLALMKKEGR